MNDGLLNKETDANQMQTTKTVKIGRSEYTVISVFNGTRTASSILYDAAVKKIIADQFDL
jgi:hypothetical protein